MAFFWKHSIGRKPIIPAGSIDASDLNDHIAGDLETMNSLLKEDPEGFRKMMLYSSFSKGYIPDFNDQISSRIYNVRYCNILALHYYVLYHMLISALLETNIREIRLLSFGCGSMVDALSLSYVLRQHEDIFKVRYKGVDMALWPSVFPNPFESVFIKKPMEDFWDRGGTYDENVFLFPTVLGELPELPDIMARFCKGLEGADLTSDTIYVLVCYRAFSYIKSDWRLTDWQKVSMLISTMEKKGYEAENMPLNIPDDWKIYLHSEDALSEDGRAWPCYCLAPPYGIRGGINMWEFTPDFAPGEAADKYLESPGILRENCSYFAHRKDQYLARHPEEEERDVKADRICRETCPIVCRLFCRTVLGPISSPGLQWLVFHKRSVS